MIQMSPEDYVRQFGNAYADSQYETNRNAGYNANSNPYASQFVVTGLPQQNQPQQQNYPVSSVLTPQMLILVMMAILVIVAIVAIVIMVRDRK